MTGEPDSGRPGLSGDDGALLFLLPVLAVAMAVLRWTVPRRLRSYGPGPRRVGNRPGEGDGPTLRAELVHCVGRLG